MSGSADFAYGTALQAFGPFDPEERLTPVLTKGEVLSRLVSKERPSPDAPEAFLLAYPDSREGIAALVLSSRGGQNAAFVAAWPFARRGISHDLIVETVHQDGDCSLLRLCDVSTEGLGLTVFDTLCTASQQALGSGSRMRGWFHAWAIILERAPCEPVVISAESASAEILANFRDAFERDGRLVLHTERLASILSRGNLPSPLYDIRGPIKAVFPGPRIYGFESHVLTVTVARPNEGEGEFDIEITVSHAVWKGEPPRIDEPVQGLIWLQAVFEPKVELA